MEVYNSGLYHLSDKYKRNQKSGYCSDAYSSTDPKYSRWSCNSQQKKCEKVDEEFISFSLKSYNGDERNF